MHPQTSLWGVLRNYQQGVAEKMIHHMKWLVYLPMGMGKTLTTLAALDNEKAFPCIIVCSKSAMAVWEEEISKWLGYESTIYAGKPKERDAQFKDFVATNKKFIITNYSLIKELGNRLGLVTQERIKKQGSGDRGKLVEIPTTHPGTTYQIKALICDEIQRGGLFNHKTASYLNIKQIAEKVPYVYLLTGTPYRKGVIDFFGPLSIAFKDEFNHYWKYVTKWCVTLEGPFGKSIERIPADPEKFRAMLNAHASVLRKEDHLKELPPKTRQAIPVTMTKTQQRIYDELTEELISLTDEGDLLVVPSRLALLVRLRQLLVSPQMLGINERGAALDAIMDEGGDLLEDRKSFVVFTPFKRALPFIEQAIEEDYRKKFPDLRVFKISGGLTAQEFGDQWQGFRQCCSVGIPSILICVIKSGASFQAQGASTAFFLGCEFSFEENFQAEDRLHRIGQQDPVTCYYTKYTGTVDDDLFAILNDKVYSADLVLSSQQEFEAMLNKRYSKRG